MKRILKRLTLKMMKLSMKILRGSMVGTKVTMNVEREKNEDLEAVIKSPKKLRLLRRRRTK